MTIDSGMAAAPRPLERLFEDAPVEAVTQDDDGNLVRTVVLRNGMSPTSILSPPSGPVDNARSAYDAAWLSAPGKPLAVRPRAEARFVDLFAGCGGLSVGIDEACRALGIKARHVLANDLDPEVLSIYAANFPGTEIIAAPIETLLDGEIGSKPTLAERRLKRLVGKVDLVAGGPPCQGHSDLNNHTRNDDPKNDLYLRMARFCEVIRPTHVIIENVPGVERDRRGAAHRTRALLQSMGYSMDSGTIDASRIGVAQRRKRNFTIASLAIEPSISQAVADLAVPQRDLHWAIGDLRDSRSIPVFDEPPSPNATTRKRIDYLFDEDLHDLPDSQRPDCHRLKSHSYVSMYGRLHWDLPAPTITTGFGTIGRGRYLHPDRRRTITPHEAARIQFFPDFYTFPSTKRTLLQTVIGNAVPPKLGYAVALHLLR
jgi:DNA (cytosine-5)-methyltransferase 1